MIHLELLSALKMLTVGKALNSGGGGEEVMLLQ